MWLKEKQFRIRLGGNTYVDVPDLVVYKGKPYSRLSATTVMAS